MTAPINSYISTNLYRAKSYNEGYSKGSIEHRVLNAAMDPLATLSNAYKYAGERIENQEFEVLQTPLTIALRQVNGLSSYNPEDSEDGRMCVEARMNGPILGGFEEGIVSQLFEKAEAPQTLHSQSSYSSQELPVFDGVMIDPPQQGLPVDDIAKDSEDFIIALRSIRNNRILEDSEKRMVNRLFEDLEVSQTLYSQSSSSHMEFSSFGEFKRNYLQQERLAKNILEKNIANQVFDMSEYEETDCLKKNDSISE